MQSQQHLFELPQDITYLNGAYMSPQLRSVTEIGLTSVQKKALPHLITQEDFFQNRIELKKKFAQLIDVDDYRNIAIIPSVSYGIANAALNCHLEKNDEIIIVDEQFPSNYYAWQQLATQTGALIKVCKPPKTLINRGKLWNQSIIDAIHKKTKVVTLPHVHWADGTLFDLALIRKKTKLVGAKLIIDGTQSVGAYPFSVKHIQPDALICGGYKWLLGPYSLGVAYYADSFNDGIPIEHNWMNRYNSEDFTLLTEYQDQYQPKAAKYNVGESSNFILVPMLIKAIEQLIDWKPTEIQKYCKGLLSSISPSLQKAGYYMEDENYRSAHLFGLYLNDPSRLDRIKAKLKAAQIFVSYRGKAIRISPNVYNTKEDFENLLALLQKMI